MVNTLANCYSQVSSWIGTVLATFSEPRFAQFCSVVERHSTFGPASDFVIVKSWEWSCHPKQRKFVLEKMGTLPSIQQNHEIVLDWQRRMDNTSKQLAKP